MHMESRSIPEPEVVRGHEAGDSTTDAKFEEHVAEGKLTYGGFISLLQSQGVDHRSVRATTFGTPIGKGHYFLVYRHEVSAIDYQSMWLSISGVGHQPFQRPVPRNNTYVAIKRMNVIDETGEIDISDQQQLYAICREITALIHPNLRDNDSIIKLQAIIWENGFSTGYENGSPLWPSLVMEYCDTTLADYLSRNPLTVLQGATIFHKIGAGLDALHSANIFHGDLKAENVLLKIDKSGNLEPKLADFGCSITFVDEEGKTKYHVAGTRLWCAPECPGWFTKIEEIEATDSYSFGLLALRIHAGGKNPFEEFGVIPEEWTPEEKLCAIEFMKKTDSLYALICGTEDIENLPPPVRYLASLLIADPTARMDAINKLDLNSELASTIERMQSLNLDETEAVPDIDTAITFIEKVREEATSMLEPGDTKLSSPAEEGPDIRDPLSFVSGFVGKSFVPDCARLSETKRRAALNPATTARIVTELTSNLEDEGIFPPRTRCPECCRLTVLDQYPQSLTADSLLQELQQHVQNPLLDHTCQELIGSILTPYDIKISVAIFGAIREPSQDRKWRAMWQLFLSTATGFGTQKDPRRALQILEDASASGFTAAANYFLYAAYTKQQINPDLPLRTWLVMMVLFSAGIPSYAFSALQQLDPPLSKLVAMARSKVYNGSTASFENLKFNSLLPRDNPGCEVIPGFIVKGGRQLVQDELFENTLLHLAAGSHSADSSMISYCIDILEIEIDVRNAGGSTPLLLACRAGREEKILTLLKLGARVDLTYECGETPLHWLGLLPDPSRVLHEFLNRDADINAQVHKGKLLPNFIEGSGNFFLAAGPIVWAMAMDNKAYVEALLRNGADLHFRGPTGNSAIGIACWPRFSKFLPRLSQEKTFKVAVDDAYTIIASWSRWNEMGLVINRAEPKEQEETLELVLSFAGPFDTIKDIYDFYRYLVPEAISESRIEILEIVFSGLTQSVGAVQNPGPGHDDYLKSPFSHPLWADHYFAHEAARRGDTDILRAVLRMNVDAAAIDSFGWTALHTLSANSDNPDCVDVLISHGALEVLDKRLPGWGLSAFMNAIASCNFKVADRLLSYTPPAERKELISSHPARGLAVPGLSIIGNFVAWSPYFGKKPLEYLFNLPDIRDDPGSVFIADERNQTTVIMLAAGSFSDSIYDRGYFATWRRKIAYEFLLTKFPESRHINAKENCGRTALHLAAWTGNLDIAIMLADRGAELNAVDKSGCTPLDVLFHPDPPYLQQDRDAKKMMIENFEKGRNEVYTVLKSRGGRHKIRAVDMEGVTEDLPRPSS